jgi:hypothetical protein
LVTEPELFAIGDAVADTPPMVSAFTGDAKNSAAIA